MAKYILGEQTETVNLVTVQHLLRKLLRYKLYLLTETQIIQFTYQRQEVTAMLSTVTVTYTHGVQMQTVSLVMKLQADTIQLLLVQLQVKQLRWTEQLNLQILQEYMPVKEMQWHCVMMVVYTVGDIMEQDNSLIILFTQYLWVKARQKYLHSNIALKQKVQMQLNMIICQTTFISIMTAHLKLLFKVITV